ncbi:MAG: DUF115 domain-containing protein [Desulfobacteraceae bacterium]
MSLSIKQYKNKYLSKRVFIIGNGPSLKKHDLSLLREEYVFVVNLFTLHPEFKNYKHCFFCLGDPRFYQQNRLLSEIGEALTINNNINCFFDIRASEALNQEKKIKKNKIFFVEIDPEKKCWEGYFHADVEKKLCWGYSVVIDQCIPLAIYMGFNPIYLIGCDCDYRLKNNSSDFTNSYFYNPKLVSPKYLRSLYQSQKLPDQFNQSGKTVASYKTVKNFCLLSGIDIKNAGSGGKLEVFERILFSSLF